MTAKVNWLVEGRVLNIHIEGRLSMNEFEKLDEQIINLLKAATAPQVHFIINTGNLEALPPIHELGRLRHLKHFRYGWLITVGTKNKHAIHTAFVLLAQMFKVRHIEMQTFDEAVRYLYSVEPTLTGEPASVL
jgi:hypothetical protein